MKQIKFKTLEEWAKDNNFELKPSCMMTALDYTYYFKELGYLKYLMDKFEISEENPLYSTLQKSSLLFNYKLTPSVYDYYIEGGIIYAKIKDLKETPCTRSFYIALDIYDDLDIKFKKGIICICGNFTFYLTYGSYEVFAECSNCGLKESIYSE